MRSTGEPNSGGNIVESVSKAETSQILERLRDHGVRVTGTRAAVVRALTSEPSHHVTAGHLYARLVAHDPRFHESTVYRTLERLVEVGVVTRIEVDSGPSVYHLAVEAPHHHLACERCGRVVGVPTDLVETLAEELRERFGFLLRADAVTFPGRCVDCLASTPSGAGARGEADRGSSLAHDH